MGVKGMGHVVASKIGILTLVLLNDNTPIIRINFQHLKQQLDVKCNLFILFLFSLGLIQEKRKFQGCLWRRGGEGWVC